MKKLTTSVDSRNRDLAGVFQPASFVNYYVSPTGNESIEIPEYASYIELSTREEGAWYCFGGSDVVAVAPTDSVSDGSAPNYLIPNSSKIHRLLSETHVSIESDGPVVVSYWGQ
jgi:hypothetical protein